MKKFKSIGKTMCRKFVLLDMKGRKSRWQTSQKRVRKKSLSTCWTNICIYFVTTMRESEEKKKIKFFLTHAMMMCIQLYAASLNFCWTKTFISLKSLIDYVGKKISSEHLFQIAIKIMFKHIWILLMTASFLNKIKVLAIF